jgi:hypothetical protein
MQINLQNWNPILVYGLTPILCCASNLEQVSHCIIPGCVRERVGGEYSVFRIKDIVDIGFSNLMNYLQLPTLKPLYSQSEGKYASNSSSDMQVLQIGSLPKLVCMLASSVRSFGLFVCLSVCW